MESGGLHAQFEGFITVLQIFTDTVEAVPLQNLPQTLRGRERSKRGYASPLLLLPRTNRSNYKLVR